MKHECMCVNALETVASCTRECRMLSCDDAVRANNTRSSEKRFREKGMEEGRAVQAGDGWMDGGREGESGSKGC